MGKILVTGASGNVGAAVGEALERRGLDVVRASTRSVAAADLAGWTSFDFHDPATFDAALTGVSRVFLMRPPAIADVKRTLLPFIDAARRHGVDHIVFLSVAGAGTNKMVPHWKVEKHLHTAGVPYTILRPGFFAQNLETAYRRDIVENDRIYVPAGTAPVNWIDVVDIAEVAALVFSSSATHAEKTYTLTGPGPVAWSTVTTELSGVLERPICYEPASVFGYVRHLRARGLPLDAILVQTLLHVLLRFGQGATMDETLECLLGRPGRSVQQYIRARADVWRADESSGP